MTALALLLSAAYFIVLSVYLSNHRLMWGDEFIGWFLITDPSWRHALDSWNQAVDSGGPLFYVVGRALVAVFGPHPVVLRLFSAGCLWLAAVLWFDLLRRKFSAAPALFVCALVWLGDWWYVYFLGEVRFYGLLVLAVAVAAVATVWIADRKPRPAVCFLLMFGAGSLLITSHMLGVVYGAFFVATLVVSRLPWRERAAAIAGMMASWSLILLFRTALKAGAAAYLWVSMPHAMDLVRFHLHTPVYSAAHPTLSVVVSALLAVLLVTGAVLALGSRTEALRSRKEDVKADAGRRLLLILCGLLMLLPEGLYLLSHLYKPVWVGRYMMPYDLGLAGCCCGAVWIIGRQGWYVRLPWPRFALAAVAVVAVLLVHVSNLRQQPFLLHASIDPYLSLHASLPLVLQDPDLFLQSRYYGGASGSQVYFVLPKLEYSTFDAVLRRGYQPGLIYDRDFFPAHPAFLYLDIPKAHVYFFEREHALHPGWRIQRVGTLPYYGAATPLLKVEQ